MYFNALSRAPRGRYTSLLEFAQGRSADQPGGQLDPHLRRLRPHGESGRHRRREPDTCLSQSAQMLYAKVTGNPLAAGTKYVYFA